MAPANALDFPADPIREPRIEIYGPPVCPNCDKAMGLFDRADVEYTKITILDGDSNHEFVTKTLGYGAAPVIVVTFDGKRIVHWGGHRQDMLTGLTRLIRKLRIDQAAAVITDNDELVTAGA